MVDHWLGGLIVLRYATKHDTVRPCPDLYHEVFNEPERDEVLTDLVCWARTRFSGLSGVTARPDNPSSPLNVVGRRGVA